MLTVVTLSATDPETFISHPEVISHFADVATARDDLRADLDVSSTADYREQVLAWFDCSRDVPGMIPNDDGSVDLWMFEAVAQVA